ncbi:hypothetical protein SAMN02745247_01124 [Butyrivibrio hungatei DSM 14810]|uniref:Uncharacterized protein n=1 Tax=Butyrivibrio hungatei DSM 14810 TaxID=1121132 RepID=A0A1M7S6I4_9FIRM|nr:hypothetical protein [Butyrivibrio hungatei]SHN53965.1 hypothetical protein SAMN02745247_01124 [Butyrivibrio hungatei DSM 14810]
MSRLTKIEQKTVINFNSGEEEAVVYTRDRTTIRKLDSLVTEFPDAYRCIKATDIGKWI